MPGSMIDRVVLGTILAVLLIYESDYLLLKSKAAPLGSVTVHRLYVTPLKGGKMQYTVAGDEQRACVQSLFPHFGDQPCWYLARHPEEQINQ